MLVRNPKMRHFRLLVDIIRSEKRRTKVHPKNVSLNSKLNSKGKT